MKEIDLKLEKLKQAEISPIIIYCSELIFDELSKNKLIQYCHDGDYTYKGITIITLSIDNLPLNEFCIAI